MSRGAWQPRRREHQGPSLPERKGRSRVPSWGGTFPWRLHRESRPDALSWGNTALSGVKVPGKRLGRGGRSRGRGQEQGEGLREEAVGGGGVRGRD